VVQERSAPELTGARTIWLAIEPRDGPPAEVAVHFTPDCTVADLLDALAGHVGEHGWDRLALEDGQTLDPAQRLADAPLREGDVLRPVSRLDRPEPQPLVGLELRLVAGPSAGRRFRLPEGAYSLGRDQASLQILGDPTVSRLHAQVSVRDGEAFLDQIQGRNGIRRNGTLVAAPYHLRPGELLEVGRSLFTIALAPPRQPAPGRGGTVAFEVGPRQLGPAPVDPCELEDRARLSRPGLWERRPGGPGFLDVRLGWSEGPVAGSQPLLVNLNAFGVRLLAITGDEEGRAGLARWLVIQAAVLHRPSDLRIGALVSNRRLGEWGWLKWLPHASVSEGSHRKALHVADANGADLDTAIAPGGPGHRLVLVDGNEREALAAIERASGPGALVVWVGDAATKGPSAIVHVLPPISGRAEVRAPSQRLDLDAVIPDAVSVEYATRVARELAGFREASDLSVETVGQCSAPISVQRLGSFGATAGETPPRPRSGHRTSRELRLSLALDHDETRDVVVDIDADRTVGELAAALGTHVGADGLAGLTLAVSRAGRTLAAGEPIHASGLRRGDTVALTVGTGPAASQRAADDGVDDSGTVPFHRAPRFIPAPAATPFRIDAPPAAKPTLGDVLRPLLPVAIGLVLGVAVGLVTYLVGGRQIALLLFVALGPLMGIVSSVFPLTEVIGRRRAYGRGAAAFAGQVASLRADLEAALADEARALLEAAPGPEAIRDWALDRGPRLWERAPADEDWLRLRAGTARARSLASVEIGEGGDPELRAQVERLAAEYEWVDGVPLTVDLAAAGTLGLAGPAEPIDALARWLVLQAVTLHSPRDLVLAAAVPTGDAGRWGWLGWLPHAHVETAPVPGQLVTHDAEDLLKRLLRLVDERRAAGQPAGHGASVLVLLARDVPLPPALLSNLLASGPEHRLSVVVVGGERRLLPRDCEAIVEVGPERGLTIIRPRHGETVAGKDADGVPVDLAAEVSRALAPLRDPTALGAQVGVPRSANLVSVLGLREDPELAIRAAWERDLAAPGESRELSAPLGMAAGNREFSVSLRRDGPHGLVGGMTGSGKSELLQTMVAALASRYSPQTLNFLLVDYKGGAAFKDCVNLPHTVGFVTDLDGRLVNRALTSMRAELARRERLQGEAGVKDLEEFERLHPDVAPPSLLIVVDEFAALAGELPEFVDGMVDIAQRGRSLGIHLVLATQRPAGVIGPKIRANTPLRISLRFKDESDSEDVLKSKEAARPGLPAGRAFTVTSAGELVEFQAGYAGAQTLTAAGPRPIQVRDLRFGGVPAIRPGGPSASPSGEVDLRRLVRAMSAVNAELDLQPPHRPWLPALPSLLPLASLLAVQGWRGPSATIGLLDEPRNQSQAALSFPLQEEGTLLIYGGSGAGKTTLLRTLAVSVAETSDPSTLNLHVLDFATRMLGSLEELPHCGGVVMGDEVARAAKVMAWLLREAERRRALLGAAAAPTLADYLATVPAVHVPYELVLLDGYAGFVTALENVDMGAPVDAFKNLLTGGPPLGISFVVTADRLDRGVATLRVNRRIVLRSSQDDYAMFSLPRGLYEGGELEPGRGYTFTANPRGALEVQCALVGDDPGGPAQATAVAAAGARLRERYPPAAVPRIQTLPVRLSSDELAASAATFEAVLGLVENDDDTLGPARMDLAESGHFVVSGPPGSGRTSALGTVAFSLGTADEPPLTHLLTFRRQSELAGLGLWTSVALGDAACRELLDRLAAAARAPEYEPVPTVLVVDDGEELVQGLGLPELNWLTEEGAELGFRVVMAVDAQKELSSKPWLTGVMRARQALVLSPGYGADGSLAGQPSVKLPQARQPLPPGRGYLVRGGRAELVQVALLAGN
jgi:S-DNA-T family DNA segregation ATPase FtsK/SpoIIIE